MKTTYCPNLRKMPVSQLFDALGDPARLEIVRSLLRAHAAGDEMSCGECPSAVSKSTMSHHFRVLRDSGLIERRMVGKVHYLRLRADEIEARLPGFLALLGELAKPF